MGHFRRHVGSLSEPARIDYYYARTVVGGEYARPAVVGERRH